MASDRDRMAARIFLYAVLPVARTIVADDPAMAARFAGVRARIQFRAEDPAGTMGAWLAFDRGQSSFHQGLCEAPDLTFAFASLAKMNAFFAGKPVVPRISGWWRAGLLLKTVSLLMALKILMPESDPKDPAKRRLKVKLTFYMITTALSQYNKGGDPQMQKWTAGQPERIYQITVDEDIAAYLRVKAGRTQAGRGRYTRRKPFVHMNFNGVEGAYPIVMNQVDMVAAVRRGYLSIEGSPEYAGQLGDFMVRIQELIT
ncbi:MAG TPA: hypothetical protein ENF48_06445 [Desulfobacteraceae bacterium]|nr:hypothetical protein [Deltaproteobacteria bacterium]HDI59975.1 hypothetical protein [Desulfobacteraceae bacterium]